jgi:histidinol-phosphatase
MTDPTDSNRPSAPAAPEPPVVPPPAVLEPALDVARRVVRAAGDAALRHFRRGVTVERKVDRSPVTVADREAEAAMVAIVRSAYPDHAILGEETGAHAGTSEWRWILDPVDGTRGFVRGTPSWGPLVALEHRGRVVVGAMALPVLGEVYFAARGLGSWMNDSRVRLSGVGELAEATVCVGWLGGCLEPPWDGPIAEIARRAHSCWSPGDLASGAWVLSGRADAWIDRGIQTWDIAPFPVLVEEAGGRHSDLAGAATIETGCILISNGALHDELLTRLAPAAKAAPPGSTR